MSAFLKNLLVKKLGGKCLSVLGPTRGFCLGWCSNFVGSESSQKKSVKLLQNMVSNTTQPPTPSQPHTVFNFGKGGRGGGGVKVRGAIVLKAGSTIPT